MKSVSISDAFWAPRIRTNRTVTLPVEYGLLESTGRIDALKLAWKPGKPNKPHIFWDSDIAKWIEAAAYSLVTNPDKKLEARCDDVIRRLEKVQMKDGYLNSYFQTVMPERRWSNLEEQHELYCMGHLTEAAVAYYQATGKDRFLNVMKRYADHVAEAFGRGKGQKKGYCGHPEVELALVKLASATGDRKYLRLAKYFVDERGRKPSYFAIEQKECEKKGWPPEWGRRGGASDYNQSHVPVREQKDATGHSVRALYLYSGMVDVARETGDDSLRKACLRLWESVVLRRMYVTGGIGSTRHGEQFTFDYDLPNETAYAETCAAIALVFFARRMLLMEGEGRFADVMERALYNGVLSGVSLDGKKFLYANPLTVYPAAGTNATNFGAGRQPWFDCACCPPNIARLLASLGDYAYSRSGDSLRIDLYMAGQVRTGIAGIECLLDISTKYPWDGKICVRLSPEKPAAFALGLRIPGWCGRWSLRVNGKTVGLKVRDGYVELRRRWSPGDNVELELAMPVEKIESHPAVRADAGKIALQRGPMVYCLEEADNGKNLADIRIDDTSTICAKWDAKYPGGGVIVLEARGSRRSVAGWKNVLYRKSETPRKSVAIKAVPYALWDNRKTGEMMVWMNRD
jgi:DUF1680 family protein